MNMKPDFLTYLRRWMIFISLISYANYIIVEFNTDYSAFKLKYLVCGFSVCIGIVSLKLALEITRHKADKKSNDKED